MAIGKNITGGKILIRRFVFFYDSDLIADNVSNTVIFFNGWIDQVEPIQEYFMQFVITGSNVFYFIVSFTDYLVTIIKLLEYLPELVEFFDVQE